MFDYPPLYREKVLLKDVIAENDNISELTLDNISKGILGITPTTVTQSKLLYAVVKKYQYSEIGFDITDIFIDKFKSTFDVNVPFYERRYDIVVKSGDLFQHTHNRKISFSGSKNATNDRTVETNSNGSGERTEYTQQTMYSKNDVETTSHYKGQDDELIGNETNAKYDETAYDTEKLDFLARANNVVNDFIGEFYKLFMEVL